MKPVSCVWSLWE
ncbi:hypothetical protein BpHYR1_001294 [Brachionus plicatilis]|uniref:Uncharacterized protein n=1 Tax=Brachionus plicatilis TaxID=10195 RepID=A0A3M7PCX5_BRAPC|nr:hypothetical protein BpHYR1_001294 [Brachionus plicatilis]